MLVLLKPFRYRKDRTTDTSSQRNRPTSGMTAMQHGRKRPEYPRKGVLGCLVSSRISSKYISVHINFRKPAKKASPFGKTLKFQQPFANISSRWLAAVTVFHSSDLCKQSHVQILEWVSSGLAQTTRHCWVDCHNRGSLCQHHY